MATKRDLNEIMCELDKKIKHIRDSIYYELEFSGHFDDVEEEVQKSIQIDTEDWTQEDIEAFTQNLMDWGIEFREVHKTKEK